jgi:glycosyltransferase 2 family protein
MNWSAWEAKALASDSLLRTQRPFWQARCRRRDFSLALLLWASTSVKRWIQLIVSLVITLTCFWWTFKDTKVSEMLAALASANWFWLGPYLGILLFIHLCRTLRWGNLLSGIERVPFKPLNEASAIGFMMLLVLPFRLGEFARPFLVAQRSTIRRSAAMTSVVLERIVDGIVIALLLRGLLFFVPPGSADLSYIQWGGTLMFLVFGGGFAFLLMARWQQQRVAGLIRGTVGRVAPGPTEKIVGIVDGFVGALRQLPDAKNMAMFVLWTAGYWGANGLGMWVLAKAFDCSGAQTGAICEPLLLSPFAGFVVLSVLIIGLMIPAAPGSAGTFQAFVKLGLGLFVPAAVVNSSGIAFANVLWVVQILQQVLLGLVFLVASKGSFADLAGNLAKQSTEAKPLPEGAQ